MEEEHGAVDGMRLQRLDGVVVGVLPLAPLPLPRGRLRRLLRGGGWWGCGGGGVTLGWAAAEWTGRQTRHSLPQSPLPTPPPTHPSSSPPSPTPSINHSPFPLPPFVVFLLPPESEEESVAQARARSGCTRRRLAVAVAHPR